MMKQINSATITPQETPGSAIGMPRGGRGLETPESLRAAAWLLQQTPAETDAAILSRLSLLNAGLRIRAVEGLPIIVKVDGAMEARLEAAHAIAGFFSPAPMREIEAWIAELGVITRRAKDDEMTERLRLAALSKRLSAYPADIAQEAVLRHKWLFFPAWAELQDVCDKLVAARAAILWHLKNAPVEAQPEARELPSVERRREMVAEAQRVITGFAGAAK